ncbi:unnamed protein product [Arctogadus glacialis]
MSSISCTVEITNSSSRVVLDPVMFLPSGQCSVPPSPLLMPGSSGSASFTGPAGDDLIGVITYNLPDQRMLVVVFIVPSERSNGFNDFAVAIIDLIECDHNLLKLMTKGSEKGPLKASKAVAWWSSLVVRATMSDTPNAVLKVDVSEAPLSNKGGKIDVETTAPWSRELNTGAPQSPTLLLHRRRGGQLQLEVLAVEHTSCALGGRMQKPRLLVAMAIPGRPNVTKTFPELQPPSSRCATPSLSAATLASLGGTSSRRGSVEAGGVVDPDASMSELRESLSEVEEKYKKAMVSNAQLDNDKANLIYQVDTLKDVVEEMEEQTSEMKRELEDRSKELERQKHTCNVLQHKQEELKEGIRQRDELIEKHGLVILPEGTPNGDYHHEPHHAPGLTLVSQEAAQLLESAGEGPLDVRLRKQAEEKEELLAQIRRLKMQVEDERQKHAKTDGTSTDGERMENGTDLHIIEMQRDANRQVSEYKFKLSKAEQEMGTMEQNVNRLEGQVARYKASADNSEKVEDELKVEKRKLQRELRTSLDKNEEMEMTNSHLVKRLEKMKANRNALLAQQ